MTSALFAVPRRASIRPGAMCSRKFGFPIAHSAYTRRMPAAVAGSSSDQVIASAIVLRETRMFGVVNVASAVASESSSRRAACPAHIRFA